MPLFGIGQRRRRERELRRETSALLDLLQQNVEQSQGVEPGSTAFFRSSLAEVLSRLGDQGRADASAAAARGLTGGEFEIAQAANRGRVLSSSLRGLLGQSEGFLAQQRQGALSQLLQGQALRSDVLLDLLRQRGERRGQILGALSNTIGGAATVFGGGGGG